jgi:hypothetical protein
MSAYFCSIVPKTVSHTEVLDMKCLFRVSLVLSKMRGKTHVDFNGLHGAIYIPEDSNKVFVTFAQSQLKVECVDNFH